MTIRIVTDSTCDLPAELVSQLGIIVIPMYISIGEQSFRDGVDITRRDFYANLPKYEHHPTTGVPGLEQFKRAYQTAVDGGASQVLSIHVSESLSAVVDVARAAAADFTAAPVTVHDSQQLSLGAGFQVEQAARMAAGGASMAEIIPALEDLAARTYVAAGLDTLEFLRRSGRMNAIMTGLGSLIQLKPILTMFQGRPDSERVRTVAKAQARLVAMLAEREPFERFAFLHANALQKIEELRGLIAPMLQEPQVLTVDITPVIGAHIGPGAYGYTIVSKSH